MASYAAKYILPSNAERDGFDPPMALGTPENMDARLVGLGIDLEGIWWMRDNPVPEELVSFANTVVNSTTFPVRLSVYNGQQGMWSWQDSPMGQVLASFYSTFDPAAAVNFDFVTSTLGDIQTTMTDFPLIWVDAYPFIYLNDDEWLRPSLFQDKSVLPDTNYTLTRIVMGDGTPHPTYWKVFLDYMTSEPWFGEGAAGEANMISFVSNNKCMRKCQIALPCVACRKLC